MMVLPLPAFRSTCCLPSHRLVDHGVAVVMFTQRTFEFAVFPTILLFTTLLRLALNVASTCIILMEGHTGAEVQGEGGQRSVTSSLVAIWLSVSWCLSFCDHQLYGHYQRCRRIAEVGVRFVLDGMPVSRWRSTPTVTPDRWVKMRRKNAAPK
ncbi:FHIPEP family type III secretion protein [Shigella flexneri]